MRVARSLDGFGADLRYGIRVFGRSPVLLTGLVLTLSLGIGANAAIFSVFEAVLLRPLPYPDADRLVVLLDGQTHNRGVTTPTIPEIIDVRAASRSFDAITFFDTRDFQVIGGVEPQRVVGARVEPSLLPMLGVRPALGRFFDEIDRRNGNMSIVVLSDAFWRRNFGADPAVVGRTLNVDGASYEIVGVLPETFSFGYLSASPIDMFVHYPMLPEYMLRSGEFANVRRVNALARIAPGVSLESATAELDVISRSMAAAHPDLYRTRASGSEPGFFMTARPLREMFTQTSRPIVLLLLGTVALVLLIACLNAAQFLLAQAVERAPEVAVRSALGAGRGRLVRQFLVESLLLTGFAGAMGVAQALWLVRVLRALVPRGAAVVGHISLDVPVLLFLLGVTIVTAVWCAVAPALRFSHADVALRLHTRGGGLKRDRLRQALIAGEVALSVVLLIGAGLLLRSLQDLQRAQGGFTTEGVMTLRMRGLAAGAGLGELYSRYLSEIARIRGIAAAGVAGGVLPGRPTAAVTLIGEGSDAASESRQQASYQIVSGGYFQALSIPLEAGRLFTDDDRTGRPPVAIVNREMAERFWPGQDPIGRRLRAGDGPRLATMTVIGVVGNVRPPFQPSDVPQLYVSYRQQSEPNITLVVKMQPGWAFPLEAIKHGIWSVDSRQAVFSVDTLEALLARATANQRAVTVLIGGFAALALAISLSGIYTLLTYVVSRRIKEIAIRRAIGATAGDVVWSLAAPTLRWTLVGLVVGAGGAAAGSRALRAAIAGVQPLEPTLMAAVSGVYLSVVLLVIGVAARAAFRIDPAAALRAE